MSHVPERPSEFVCQDCHLIYAGNVVGSGENRRYDPPNHCAACHSENFVALSEYSHMG
ncbi:hypothetical protein [Haloprofundus salilacus]|uniref:hypothetical protein n=1 Tax=Haloprofundus salilacus TaxID=2876190 RepID=UPI001CC9709D|nr:hypothetical protein [Haloprofundus salilacus]